MSVTPGLQGVPSSVKSSLLTHWGKDVVAIARKNVTEAPGGQTACHFHSYWGEIRLLLERLLLEQNTPIKLLQLSARHANVTPTQECDNAVFFAVKRKECSLC